MYKVEIGWPGNMHMENVRFMLLQNQVNNWFWRPRYRYHDDIKVDLSELGFEGETQTELANDKRNKCQLLAVILDALQLPASSFFDI
jgi:hypothetical protein